MPKKMLINALHAEEARVAIVEDGRLMDLGIEIAGREQTRGNVYKGVVVRVEPGLQAAFIDIGLKKLGFLQMGELHPDFWQWRDDVPVENRNRRPRIQEVLRRGQELIVQVEKGERDMKGAALTSYLSLPGRYMVLMPGSDSVGVSRKVEAEGERKKLKEMAAELNIPAGIGYIIRTEALGKKQAELAKDFHYLLKLNESIREAAAKVKGAALIYQESDLIIRTIRDYFTAEIDEVLVDSTEVYEQARAFFKEVMPRMVSRVKLHQEKRPIFSRYQLEEQIDSIYEKKVPLKSGGSLVIEPAEALVSIDVNSGKSTGEKGVEDTAFKTNMEAAEEAARQLRLRDLGGLIVIDFIDMRDRKHNADVEKTLKHALKSDKARVTVGKISQFGLLEMSRQRIRQTANEAVYLECPHCEGRGRIKSVEAMAVSFLRKVHGAAAKGTTGEVRGGLPLEVAYYLLNRKKKDLARIEADYDIEVTIKGKPSFLMNQIELELVKREKLASDALVDSAPTPLVTAPVFPPDEVVYEEESAEIAEEATVADESPAGEELPEAGKKRKRRRGKKKPLVEGEAVTEEAATGAEPVQEEGAADVEESADAVAAGDGTETDPPAEPVAGSASKKRKRRRKRGKGSAGAALEAGAAPETADDLPRAAHRDQEESHAEEAEDSGAEGVSAVVGEEGAAGGETRKKRRRKRKPKRRSADGISAETLLTEGSESIVTPDEAVQEIVPELVLPEVVDARNTGVETPASAPRKPRSPRKPKQAAADQPAADTPAVTEASTDVAEPATKPPRARPVRTAKEAAPAPEPAPIASEALTEPEAAAPKRKRALRKSASKAVPAGETLAVAVAAEEGSASAPVAKRRTPRKKTTISSEETDTN